MAVPPTTTPGKMQLRGAMRALRAAYVASLRPAARDAAERALAERVVPLLAGHHRIASYQAIGAEIDPHWVLPARPDEPPPPPPVSADFPRHSAAGGEHSPQSRGSVGGEQTSADSGEVALAYPRVRGRDLPLSFHIAAPSDMVPGWSNIPEPRIDAPLVVPTALLVPLLAVDAHGNRLGYGAGHYDRTLAGLGAVLKIGLAWDVQVVDALPAETWDVPLDWIATPTRLVKCS